VVGIRSPFHTPLFAHNQPFWIHPSPQNSSLWLDHQHIVDKSSAVAEMGDRLATVDMGRKVEGCCVPFRGEAGSPSNTMLCGPRPAYLPSFIVIHPTVCNTNVTDRQNRTGLDRPDRQWFDSIGGTVLQTVAPKTTGSVALPCATPCYCITRAYQTTMLPTLVL